MSGWTYLILGIIAEVIGTFSMKLSQGFTQWVPTVFFVVFFAIALVLINLAMKTIDMSIAYAIWSGAGITILAVLGMLFLDEPLDAWRLFFMALILIGVVGLHQVG